MTMRAHGGSTYVGGRRLSRAMIEMLLYTSRFWGVHGNRVGRPTRPDNLATHTALARRGLIAVTDDDFGTTTLTKAGWLTVGRLTGSGRKDA